GSLSGRRLPGDGGVERIHGIAPGRGFRSGGHSARPRAARAERAGAAGGAATLQAKSAATGDRDQRLGRPTEARELAASAQVVAEAVRRRASAGRGSGGHQTEPERGFHPLATIGKSASGLRVYPRNAGALWT